MALKRKAHRKSRSGCSACKRRRIKCNEEKPQCSHCIRYEVACVYPQSGPSKHVSPSPIPDPQLILQPPSQIGLPNLPSYSEKEASFTGASRTGFDMSDMVLLHHWTLTTSRTICNSPQIDYLWQSVLPEIAFKHPYMMHGILSLAALHMSYLHPSDRHTHVHSAANHHALTLSGFREDMMSIGPENSDALFATATLLFLYAFLTFGKLYDGCDDDANAATRTSQILGTEWIPLIRGVRAITAPTMQHIKSGPLCVMLNLKSWDDIDPDAQPGHDDEHMLRIRENWRGDGNADTYDKTLYLLRKAIAWIYHFQNLHVDMQAEWGYNRDWSAPFIWLSLVPEEFLTMQRQRQPLALLIFAYFGALIHRLDKHWWAESCGKSIVDVIHGLLGSYWSEWMEWPMHVVGLR